MSTRLFIVLSEVLLLLFLVFPMVTAGTTRQTVELYGNIVIPPVADFTSNVTAGDIPLAVQFFDLSTNYPQTWSWFFGDGTTSNDQNPVHIYTQTGKFTVKLLAANSAGSDTKTAKQYISTTKPKPTQRPKADFSAHPRYGTAPLTVQFTDTSLHVPTSWKWDFGDGQGSSVQNPPHIYTGPGHYTVKLTASNNRGSDTETKQRHIYVMPGPLHADFTARPMSGTAPLTVQFTDTSSGDPTFWIWRFGDTPFSFSFEQNPQHTYKKSGTYTVSLTVIRMNSFDTTTKVITVYNR